jgi:hypothetical protein
MRTRIYEIISPPKKGDNASCLYDLFIVIVALLSIAPALFHANSLDKDSQNLLATIDIVTAYILCFDYLLNWMTYDIRKDNRGKWTEFLKYPFTFEAIINLLSILPTLNLLPSSFLFLRALRIIRLFQYSKHLNIIMNVFVRERKTLGSVLFLALAYIFATALIMFTFEPQTFTSFIDAVYWATITLTTIGFGDIHPTSNLGHILTSVTSIFGIFIFALPAGIMTGGFLQQLREREEEGEVTNSSNFLEGIDFSALCLTPKQLKNYFISHPKLRLYITFIFVGVALNFLLCLFFSEFSQPLWLDTTGTALVACALDPAAAILVSFVDNLIIAVYQNSPQNILYFSNSALVALVYWKLFKQREDGSLPFKNAAKVIITIIFAQSAITVFLAFWIGDGNFTTIYQNEYRSFLVEQSMDYYAASFFAIVIDRIFDSLSVFLIVNLILRGMKSKGFVASKWLLEHSQKKEKVSKTDASKTKLPESKLKAKGGILSCDTESVCLNLEGLKRISNAMRSEAKKSNDKNKSSAYLSSAETISLLSCYNIKNEEEFKQLLDEKIKEKEVKSN